MSETSSLKSSGPEAPQSAARYTSFDGKSFASVKVGRLYEAHLRGTLHPNDGLTNGERVEADLKTDIKKAKAALKTAENKLAIHYAGNKK